MQNQSLSYRPDIDGLRAIAVLSVLIFHLGIGYLPGGFVGVDIFFVISGYLISKIIYTETANKSFSIANFYVRRARRILPAFISVIAVSSIISFNLLYPMELVAYAKSAIASALFSANIHFYSTLNYFSPTADEIPLLHLWSLGIEEQFYILFPLLAIALAGRKLSAAVIVVFIASLSASVWMLTKDPSAAYYLLPFRAFELLIGSVLALPRRANNSKAISIAALVTGLACITASILLFGHNTKFPGAAALLPCIGAALAIYAGENRNGFSELLLGNRAFVFIGKISYSLYLIHWPVIVFGRRAFPQADAYTFAISALIISVVLAFLNYRFVEQYFRHPKQGHRSIKVLGIAAAVLCSMIVISGFTIYKSGFEDGLDARTAEVLSFQQYDPKPAYHSRTCFLDPDQEPSQVDVSLCLPNGNGTKVMLWGDSHAIQFYPGLKETLGVRGYSLGALTASACPPIIGIDVTSRPKCKAFNEMALPIILKEQPKILIMSASWVTDEPTMNLLEKTIQQLSKLDIKLVLLGETPLYKKSVPLIIADRLKAGNPDMTSSDEMEKEFLDNSENVMYKRFANRSDVKYISVMKAICTGYKCPLTAADESPVQFDIAHLTVAGSRLFAKELTPLILN